MELRLWIALSIIAVLAVFGLAFGIVAGRRRRRRKLRLRGIKTYEHQAARRRESGTAV